MKMISLRAIDMIIIEARIKEQLLKEMVEKERERNFSKMEMSRHIANPEIYWATLLGMTPKFYKKLPLITLNSIKAYCFVFGFILKFFYVGFFVSFFCFLFFVLSQGFVFVWCRWRSFFVIREFAYWCNVGGLDGFSVKRFSSSLCFYILLGVLTTLHVFLELWCLHANFPWLFVGCPCFINNTCLRKKKVINFYGWYFRFSCMLIAQWTSFFSQELIKIYLKHG